nr:substrate-binding domain-containing protein [Phytoactinopolyspora alkaliphila]
MVGLVVPDITNPFMPPLVRAVQRAAGDHDWSVLLVDAEEQSAAEAELISRLHGQVDGLILASPRARSIDLQNAAEDLPCVLMNRVIRGLPSVVCDNGAALAAIGDQLVRDGHRRVALLGGPASSWAAQQRARTVRAWAARAEVVLDELKPYDASFDGGREAGAALLATGTTAAFAFDDVMACGVLAELASRGVAVPGDYSVVGCDDVLLARMVTPSLTTVTAPFGELGRAAVELLRESVAEPEGRPSRVTLPGVPVTRASTGPVAARTP